MGCHTLKNELSSQYAKTGYVTEIPYTPGFIRYQTPVQLSFSAALNGFCVPDVRAPFRYCDLGCGEAVTLLTLAAAYPQAQFVGVDMNQTHIENASKLAAESNLSNIAFFHGTFAEFASDSTDSFDYVVAHGVLSWVAKEVSNELVQAVSTLLRPGGLFYACHFVRPGAGKMETLFQLIAAEMRKMNGDLPTRVRAAVDAVDEWRKRELPLFRRYPSLQEDIEELQSRDLRFLVHEFGNKHFCPRFFHDVADELAQENLVFAGSAQLARNEARNLLPEDHADVLAPLDRIEREEHASLLSHELFRWDVYKRVTDEAETGMWLKDFIVDANVFPYRFAKSDELVRRKVSFETKAFQFLVDGCSKGRYSVAQLSEKGEGQGIPPDEFHQALRDATGARWFQPLCCRAFPADVHADQVYSFTHPLSVNLWTRDFKQEGSIALPSPVLGSSIVLSRFNGMAVRYLRQRSPREAMMRLKQELRLLSADELDRLGLKAEFSDADFAGRVATFLSKILPKLVKYGILRPI